MWWILFLLLCGTETGYAQGQDSGTGGGGLVENLQGFFDSWMDPGPADPGMTDPGPTDWAGLPPLDPAELPPLDPPGAGDNGLPPLDQVTDPVTQLPPKEPEPSAGPQKPTNPPPPVTKPVTKPVPDTAPVNQQVQPGTNKANTNDVVSDPLSDLPPLNDLPPVSADDFFNFQPNIPQNEPFLNLLTDTSDIFQEVESWAQDSSAVDPSTPIPNLISKEPPAQVGPDTKPVSPKPDPAPTPKVDPPVPPKPDPPVVPKPDPVVPKPDPVVPPVKDPALSTGTGVPDGSAVWVPDATLLNNIPIGSKPVKPTQEPQAPKDPVETPPKPSIPVPPVDPPTKLPEPVKPSRDVIVIKKKDVKPGTRGPKVASTSLPLDSVPVPKHPPRSHARSRQNIAARWIPQVYPRGRPEKVQRKLQSGQRQEAFGKEVQDFNRKTISRFSTNRGFGLRWRQERKRIREEKRRQGLARKRHQEALNRANVARFGGQGQGRRQSQGRGNSQGQRRGHSRGRRG